MQLDRGIITVYKQTDVSAAGQKPRYTRGDVRAQSYYALLHFETAPRWPTDDREETQIAERVRMRQCRTIAEDDVAVLLDFTHTDGAERTYKIVRAYHGTDEDSGEAISDLSLEAYKA